MAYSPDPSPAERATPARSTRAGELPAALRSRNTLKWGGLFLLIFLAIHWQEVSSPTLNVDDWGVLGSPIPQANQSRPSWDVVYSLLFQDSFSPFLGWLLAGASLFALAACLPLFQPLLSPAWILLAALLISLHAYLLDLFNFSFAIGLYLLPAALSVWGGVLIAYNPAPPLLGRRWRDGVLGVAMVVFAMGIYQPTGTAGLTLVGWDALARALDSARPAPRSGLRLLAGLLGGCLLYGGVASVAMRGHIPNERTGFASLPRLLEKLFDTDVYREIYATHVSLLWRPAPIILSASFLLLLLVLSIRLIRRTAPGVQRLRRLGLLWFAAGWLTLSPLFLFYVLQAGFPRRSFALGNFGMAGFIVIALITLQSESGLRSSGRRFVQGMVSLLILFYVIPQAVYAGKIWERTQWLQMRDIAMAQGIAADVRSHSVLRPELPADRFQLFGTTERNQSFHHWSSVGESAFRQSWSIADIFRQLLGLDVTHIAYRSEGNENEVRSSLPACRAWPSAGSIVSYKGRWLVCLEDNPAAPRQSGRR